MAQAVVLNDETIGICATKTGQTPADLRCMLQDAEERGYTSYIVFDYYGPRGDYVQWSQMREMFFRNYFYFPWGEDPKKFVEVKNFEHEDKVDEDEEL